MGSIVRRGNKLYAKIKNVEGRWQQLRTGLSVGQEAEAKAWIAEAEAAVDAERTSGGPMTVRRWVDTWSDEQRDRGVVDWKRNKAWLVDLVVPEIGDMLVRDVRTPHVVTLFAKIRKPPSEVTGKPRAPRTMHNIHQVVHRMFADAVLAVTSTMRPSHWTSATSAASSMPIPSGEPAHCSRATRWRR